ncbi:MAG: FAD binding domain-containing protein [Hyphomicrobiaceae bacterium]
MKPPPFDYEDPETLAGALELASRLDNHKLLAGGQSLMPMLNMRFVQPDHVIDLNRIAELAYIDDVDTVVRIGSMTRQHELLESDVIARRLPLMREALEQVGHVQTRNRGTIGGSLCHLDPAAELPCVLMACDGVVEAQSVRGTRRIAMRDFPAFYMTPAIEPDEIVTAIEVAPWAAGHGSAFLEFARRHGDFAQASVAVLIASSPDGAIERASLAVGGLATAPQRIAEAERMLAGSMPTAALVRAAAQACGDIEATDDAHAPAAYRRQLAVALTERALKLALVRSDAANGGLHEPNA